MRPLDCVAGLVRDILLVIGTDGRIVDANDAALGAYGYTYAEMLALRIADLRAPETIPEIAAQMQVANERGIGFQSTHRRKDGTLFPCEISSQRAEVLGEQVLVSVIRDITERKLAEEALRHSEDRFRLLSDAAFEGVAVHEAGKLVDVNPALAQMHGLTRAEMVGRSFLEFLAPRFRDDARARAATNESLHYAAAGLRKDGTEFPVELRAKTVQHNGRNMRVVAVRDTSDRERAEQLVRRSEESFRSLIERSPYGILVHRNKRIVYVNPAAVSYLGFERADELVGRSAFDLSPASERSPADARLKRRDGSEVVADVVGLHVDFDGEPAVMVFLRDVTETRLEEQLRQSQKMDAIGRLAGGVAHDFNNLLTAILGHSELLLQTDTVQPPQRRQAEQIHRAASRAAQLTSQLLAFSRKQVLQPKILDLNVAVTAMTTMLRRLIGEDVELSAQLDPSLWRVKADPGQIEQVLLNLTVNARDAMPSGGELTIHTRNATVAAGAFEDVPPGRYVLLEVEDDGVGMDVDTRARAFEPFFTTKSRGKGTGLGLSTVYGIVTQSGGYIAVESEPQRGALFRVWLPAVDAPVSQPAVTDSVVARGAETILLVEDDADVRVFISDVLDTHGYQVLQARDGVEALSVIEAHAGRVDLLLTDVIMPRMSGSEVAARLHVLRPSLKVLYISGYPGETMVRQGALAADLTFLQKPFSVAALARRVREVLDNTS